VTTPPPGRPRLVGADASHAWVSVYCPGVDWLDVDPTNNVVPDDRHVTVAWGRDFSDVTPMRGVILGGGAHDVRVAVDVAPPT
jgi:transglutaminase-like putative cysteine protease